MLQRAASNAYSWWWASHIRTKQSKWLEHNLQDMEEKVKYTLKIIDEDGDTFAKRAEMYYRKRPEIVNFVEEAFRSYRALAERYDHLSTELQSANHMIATAFPEHIQFPLDDDYDEDNPEKPPKDPHQIPYGTNIPEVPEIPKKEFKSQSLMMLPKKGPGDGDMKRSTSSSAIVSSGLSKEEALEEIDKIHKGILVLQTEKEFVRSSYEQTYERYWNLENEVTEMQKRVCSLQDEFGVGAEIEDGEARTLVASTALSSCKETIAKLEETQKRFSEDAELEKQRIDTATEKFEALRNRFEIKVEEDEEAKKAFTAQESSYESNEVVSNETPSNMEFTEKIDELVEKVVTLETTASSHTTMVKTLRSETDELHEHIRGVEEDKACLVSDSIDMKRRITSLEDELSKVRKLFERVDDQNKNLEKHLIEANTTAEDLSGKLQEVKMDEDDVQEEDHSEEMDSISKKSGEEIKETIVVKHNRDQESAQEEKSETESTCFGTEAEDEERRNWRQMLPEGMEDREKVILDEYTSVLRDYREVKRKLSELEKKNRDGFFELALQLRELKNAVSREDMESHLLPQKPEMPGKDSPHPNQPESVSISPRTNSSVSMAPSQEGEDLKRTDEKTKEDEVKVKDSPRKKNRDGFFELALQLRELKNAVSREDMEFHLLPQKPEMSGRDSPQPSSNSSVSMAPNQQGEDLKRPAEKTKEEEVKVKDSPRKKITTVETKVRGDIDAVLEENIEFWLRFSTSVHQIQKYQTAVQDLKAELSKLKQQDNASEAKPIYKHLREIRTELQLWLENSAVLRDELEGRYATLCTIKDEVSKVTCKSGGTEVSDTEISGYQAAKFHGEILGMKMENKRVFAELETGLSRATALRSEVERVVSKLEKDLGISNAKTGTRTQGKTTPSSSKPRIPLRSFLFGVRLKKYKQQAKQTSSIFSCVAPSPALQKQCSYMVPPVKLQ